MPLFGRKKKQATITEEPKVVWAVSPTKIHKVDPGNPKRTACGYPLRSTWEVVETLPQVIRPRCALPECK